MRSMAEGSSAAQGILLEGQRTLLPHVDVSFEHVIGSGAFGDVYAASWRHSAPGHAASAESLAVKVIKKKSLSEKARAQLVREVALHATIHHTHIVRCHGAYEASGALHLVLARCAGDVASAMRRGAAAAISTLAPRLMRQLLLALRHLHSDAIAVVHADIKPSNLLLSETGVLQLCDLGAAARVHAGGGRSTLVGSPAYHAPEVVAVTHLGLDVSCGASYGFASDMWSAGVCLVEMLTQGGLPFPATRRDAAAQLEAVCFRPPRLEPASAFSPAGRAFALALLAKQAYLRPSAEGALSDVETCGGEGGGFLPASDSPTADDEEATRVCLDCLARGEEDEAEAGAMRLCGRFAEADMLESPPACATGGADSTKKCASGRASGSERSGDETDDSPMSAPSWTSSLVELEQD